MEETGFVAGRAARYAQAGAAPSTGCDVASWRVGGPVHGDQNDRVIDLLMSPQGVTQLDATRVCGSIRLAATVARLRERLPIRATMEGWGSMRYARYSVDVGAWAGIEESGNA